MSTSGKPNILLLIADDLGKDLVQVTGSGFSRKMQVRTSIAAGYIIGQMPNVSLILRNGVEFTHAWAQPACSPTRASIYTGLHPWKHGVGSPMGNPILDTTISLATLPELLPSDYASGLFGKWHLGDDAATSPLEHGWDKHYGTFAGVVEDYNSWAVVDSDGIYDQLMAPYSIEYATAATVKAAANWINGLQKATPWFATLAFHTPHSPFHEPPAGTTGFTSLPIGADSSDPDYEDKYNFNLMTQSMDHYIGGLLGTAGSGGVYGTIADFDFSPIPRKQLENTLLIFIGDNGSDPFIAIDEAKTYIYEGSVRVPMIIADGTSVMGEFHEESAAPRFLHQQRIGSTQPQMTHIIDLYTTILRMINPNTNSMPGNCDSVDLTPYLTTAAVVWRQPSRPLRPTTPLKRPNDQAGPIVDFPHFPLLSLRGLNFSQWYTSNSERATIRNSAFKLNYDHNPNSGAFSYALYRYEDGEVPGREDGVAPEATDLYDDAINRRDEEARSNLDTLLDELLTHYKRNQTEDFQDPRPFPVP